MPTREEIQREMEGKLHRAEEGLEKLKQKAAEAGDETSDEMRQAISKAEDVLNRGRKKLDELAEASDETFEDWWEGSKEGWKQLTRSMDSHWDEFSARVRNFFS
jgi:superfamily II RNA helicase